MSHEDIRARLAAATPGPWQEFPAVPGAIVAASEPYLNLLTIRHPPDDIRYAVVGEPADTALIAHAPTDLATLLDEVDRLTAELAEARATIENERGEGTPPVEGWIRNDFDAENVGIAWYAAADMAGAFVDSDVVEYVYVLWVYREPASSEWRWEVDDDKQKGINVYLADGTAITARAAMRAASAAVPR